MRFTIIINKDPQFVVVIEVKEGKRIDTKILHTHHLLVHKETLFSH